MSDFCNFKNMAPATSLELRGALKQIIADRKLSGEQLAGELTISTNALDNIISGVDDSIESWIAIQGRIIEVLRFYDALPQDDSIDAETPTIVPAICADVSTEEDPFAGNAEDVAAKETRERILLFDWADSVLGLNEVDMELEFEQATKRFNRSRGSLKGIIKARRNDRRRKRPNQGRNDRPIPDPIFVFTAKISDRPVVVFLSGDSTAMASRSGNGTRPPAWISMHSPVISAGRTGAHMLPSPIGTAVKRSSRFRTR